VITLTLSYVGSASSRRS